MRVIRHQIGIVDKQTIELPAYGDLLFVAVSRTIPNHGIDLWSVDFERGRAHTVDVYVVGTGNPMDEDTQEAVMFGKFLGTVVTPSGLVWHVWQGKIR